MNKLRRQPRRQQALAVAQWLLASSSVAALLAT